MRTITLIWMSTIVLFGLAGMIGGCADPDSGPSPYGSITATVVWPGENDAGASDGLLGPRNWVVPAGVATILGFVTAADISTPPETTISVTAGESGTGVIENVPVGSDRTLTVQGLDSVGTVLYEGFKTGIIVTRPDRPTTPATSSWCQRRWPCIRSSERTGTIMSETTARVSPLPPAQPVIRRMMAHATTLASMAGK